MPDRLATSSDWLATLAVLYRRTDESHSSVLKVFLKQPMDDLKIHSVNFLNDNIDWRLSFKKKKMLLAEHSENLQK